MSTLPLSALVTSRNEGHLLGPCLDAIAFCDELIVIAVECTDDTAAVAAAHGARVVEHPYVPIAEAARVTVAPQARHDWLLVVDPDEIVPPALAREVARLLPELDDDIAAVDTPLQYFFGDRRLRGTVWGGANKRRLLVNRRAVELTPTVWGGMRLHPGTSVIELPFTPETASEHHWASSYRELVARHRRYLELEIPYRLEAGEVTGLRRAVTMPVSAFWQSYVTKRGYLDGVTGLLLSGFWAAFRTVGEWRLYRALRRRA